MSKISYLLIRSVTLSGNFPALTFLYGGLEKINSYFPSIFFIFSFNGVIFCLRLFISIFFSNVSYTSFCTSTAIILSTISISEINRLIMPCPAPISKITLFLVFGFLFFLLKYFLRKLDRSRASSVIFNPFSSTIIFLSALSSISTYPIILIPPLAKQNKNCPKHFYI